MEGMLRQVGRRLSGDRSALQADRREERSAYSYFHCRAHLDIALSSYGRGVTAGNQMDNVPV